MTAKCLSLMVILSLWLAACGSTGTTTNKGGTETGNTTSVDTTKLASRLTSTAELLVANITSSSSSNVSTTKAVSYGSSSDWEIYRASSNNTVLTDIFGSASEDPKVVTKVRVLLSQFSKTVSDLFTRDPDITCHAGKALSQGDKITISFYGAISNGTSSDRYFDCVTTNSGVTTIYGKDASSVVRIATMSDETSSNTDKTETRGTQVRIRSVIYSTYAEATESGATAIYLDLQVAHSTTYVGPDGSFGTSDDVIFKSRSRVTGRSVLDGNSSPSAGKGEFTTTKYDKNGSDTAIITKNLGRGSFGASDYSLFKINSTVTALAAVPGTFCIQTPSSGSGLPSHADSGKCSALESSLAWAAFTFPYSLSPEISADFTANAFYEGNDTDMLANDGSNFSIPTY